jgi:hypothetical protein
MTFDVHFGTVFGSILRGGGVPLFFLVIRLSRVILSLSGGVQKTPKGGLTFFVPSSSGHGPIFGGCDKGSSQS